MAVSSAMTGANVRLHTRSPAFRASQPRPVVAARPNLTSSVMGDMSACPTATKMFGLSSQSRTANRKVVTMAAKVTAKIKLELTAGKANPAPPIGPALGSKGVNIMAFCKEYNAQTQKMAGEIIPVEITVYEDRSFTFILKTPPAAILLKKAAGITAGAAKPNKDIVGKVTRAQVAEIAQKKLPDTNATKLESAIRMIEGTARSLGLQVVD